MTTPYEKAKVLAITEQMLRIRWWEEAVKFWTDRFTEVGDDVARTQLSVVELGLAVNKYQLEHLKNPSTIVGGHWLFLAQNAYP